nr:hypothetical protein OG284_13145 [Streptomyces sp. NBC_01177]
MIRRSSMLGLFAAAALDTGDHLHLNPSGYRAMADAVPTRLFARPRCPGASATGNGGDWEPQLTSVQGPSG